MTDSNRALVDTYDVGLLSDYGGGNVEWWQDYIRSELARAHDFYAEQIASSTDFDGLEGAPSKEHPQAPSHSEIEPDDGPRETRRSLDQQGGDGGKGGRCDEVFASGAKLGECHAGHREHPQELEVMASAAGFSALPAAELAALVPTQEVAGLVEEALMILRWVGQTYGDPEGRIERILAALSPPSQGVESPDASIFRTSPGQCFECEADLQSSTALRGAFVCLACNPEIAHPDVSGLVEALEKIKAEDHDELGQTGPAAVIAHDALAAFQSRQEGK